MHKNNGVFSGSLKMICKFEYQVDKLYIKKQPGEIQLLK